MAQQPKRDWAKWLKDFCTQTKIKRCRLGLFNPLQDDHYSAKTMSFCLGSPYTCDETQAAVDTWWGTRALHEALQKMEAFRWSFAWRTIQKTCWYWSITSAKAILGKKHSIWLANIQGKHSSLMFAKPHNLLRETREILLVWGEPGSVLWSILHRRILCLSRMFALP